MSDKEAYQYIGRYFVCLEDVTLREAKTASGDLCDDFEIRKADLYAAAFYAADALEEGCATCPRRRCFVRIVSPDWLVHTPLSGETFGVEASGDLGDKSSV